MVLNQHCADRLSKKSAESTLLPIFDCLNAEPWYLSWFLSMDFLQSHRCYLTCSKTIPYARTQVGPSPPPPIKVLFKIFSHELSSYLPTYEPTKLLMYQPALLFIFGTAAISPTDRFDLLFFGFSIYCARAAAILSTVLTSPKLESQTQS